MNLKKQIDHVAHKILVSGCGSWVEINQEVTSWMYSEGMCGKKSLPLKKHIKMKSSISLSMSGSNFSGGSLISMSIFRYSLRIQEWRNCLEQNKTEKRSKVYIHCPTRNKLNLLNKKIVKPDKVFWPILAYIQLLE